MKLFYSVTSPFARKVLICAKEHGLDSQLELKVLHPIQNAEEVAGVSPLGKVPALQVDGRRLVVDSPVICEYLDKLAVQNGSDSLAGPAERADDEALIHALADGIMDAAYLYVMESLRPEEQQSDFWKSRWQGAVVRTLDYLESEMVSGGMPSSLTLAGIALGCALGYLDFRLDHLDWREGRRALAEWYAATSLRDSFRETVPVA